MNKHIFTAVLTTLLLSGCSSNGPIFHSWGDYEKQRTENAIYRVEEPYEIKGVWYVPTEQTEYSEKGLASWYMPAGDYALTANGEVYDVNIPSARHKTLPLPSIVKITNLENNKSVIARVNDRGPMVNNRLIDVSQAAAKELEMPVSGTVLVQVDLLPEESAALKRQLVEAGHVYQSAMTTEVKPIDEGLLSINTPNDVIYDGTVSTAGQSEKLPVVKTQEAKLAATKAETVQAVKTEKAVPAPVMSGPSIQLGSFADAKNAQKLMTKLSSEYPVRIETVQRNGRTLSVVKAGPFNNKQQAAQTLQQLKKMGYKDAYLAR